MTSIAITIFISIIIIFVIHAGFTYMKNHVTPERTENIGIYQSKKYEELINELKSVKEINLEEEPTIDEKNDMETELTDFMNDLE